MTEVSMLNMVTITLGVCIIMALLCCLCCFCMKLSDMRMRNYIMETAHRKGLQIDLDTLELNYKPPREPPEVSEVCTVIIPDYGIVF